jgi:bisphosphoglycerate-dependent phosphoglycerate mutase
MDTQALPTMSKEEYMALAEQKYNDLQGLKKKPTFYDYEQSFEQIWLDLGRQILEKSLSDIPEDRRKKKAWLPDLG